IGTAEAMNLGQKLGMDPTLLASILNTSSGRCWASEISNPCPDVITTSPASNQYDGGFGVTLMAKDMGLAINAANESKSTVALGALSHQIYNLVGQTPGFEKKDFGSVFKWIRNETCEKK
ncbi:6-phosphogluconate dehydrogenase, partial [Dimargaris cristalligena]